MTLSDPNSTILSCDVGKAILPRCLWFAVYFYSTLSVSSIINREVRDQTVTQKIKTLKERYINYYGKTINQQTTGMLTVLVDT